jgi:hypothetical protein
MKIAPHFRQSGVAVPSQNRILLGVRWECGWLGSLTLIHFKWYSRAVSSGDRYREGMC